MALQHFLTTFFRIYHAIKVNVTSSSLEVGRRTSVSSQHRQVVPQGMRQQRLGFAIAFDERQYTTCRELGSKRVELFQRWSLEEGCPQGISPNIDDSRERQECIFT